MKICPQCENPVSNNRKKFCSDHCKWLFNSIKRDKEKGLPPVKKRNKNYFYMTVGSSYDNKGQGRRSGGMITGGMSARIPHTVDQVVEVNKENLLRHFKGIPGHIPTGFYFGDHDYCQKENVEKVTGIKIN